MQLRQRMRHLTLFAVLLNGGIAEFIGRAAGQRAVDDAKPGISQQEEQSRDDRPTKRRRGRGLFGWREPRYTTNNRATRDVFTPVVREASKSTVCIHCDGKHTILGGVVSAEGWVLTKASVLSGELTVHRSEDDEYPAELYAVDNTNDLALLRVEHLTGVPPLDLGVETTTPQVGAWVATVSKSGRPGAVGIVSVPPREIEHQRGVLGVAFAEDQSPRTPPVVHEVIPNTAAEAIGIQVDDLFLSVDGQQVSTRLQMIRAIGQHLPGETVKLRLRRDGKEIELTATLGGNFPRGFNERAAEQSMMGGDLSDRRFGFPRAFQHDSVLDPMECGGPLVDLEGKLVGFNIARSGRTESYALGLDVVRPLVERWLHEAETEQVKLEEPEQ